VVIAIALVIPETVTGTELSVVVPLPSSPKLFAPQQRTEPPLSNAQARDQYALIAVASVILETVTGTELLVVVPLPS
jgi:hypothetical protein